MISRRKYITGGLFSIILALTFVSAPHAHAASPTIYIYPATSIAPRGTYQSVTSIITGVNDKTVTWSAPDGGTIVGTNPCIVNEPCTAALYTTTPGNYRLIATSNANPGVSATSHITITASPTPVTTWPRFLITQASLPGLQAKATPDNVTYQALRTLAIATYNNDNNIWSWTCNGGTGQPSSDQTRNSRESDVYYLSYMALVDPSDPTYNWGCYAHDVGMYVMTNYPTAYPDFVYPVKDLGVYFIFVDWMRGAGLLNSSELTTMRTFESWFAVTSFLGGGASPDPSNTYNSSEMFSGSVENGTPYPPGPQDLADFRSTSGNNYSLARMLNLAYVGLDFNDNTTDAPNIPTGIYNTCGASRYQVCADGTAGSLIAYWKYLDGAILYDYWAHIEDPNVSWQAYQAAYGNLPTQPTCENTDLLMHPCFGDGRDGGSSEGSWYQYSMYLPRWMLNILHTTGMDDPLLYGPQISVSYSSWWDLKYVHDLEIITGPNSGNISTIIQPALTSLGYGDEYYYWDTIQLIGAESALISFDSYTGRSDRTNALKWMEFNFALGGPLGNLYNCTTYCGYDYNIGNPAFSNQSLLDMFIALPAGDPVGGTLPSDPRPSLPLDYYDGSFNQSGVSRSSWSPNATLFSYWFNNSYINHEYNIDGRFDVFSDGEYITKGRDEFNNYDNYMSAAPNQNTLAVFNSTVGCAGTWPNSGSCPYYEFLQNGGQLAQEQQAGLVTVTHSELPTYVAAIGDTTNAYNGEAANGNYAAYNEVKSASRSIIYLKGTNQVVYYDRAVVAHVASVQSLSQVTTGNPTIVGSTASWPTRSGNQKAYFTSLLPSGGTISNIGLACPDGPSPECNTSWQPQDWEPAAVLQVTPPTAATSSQFLSVLQWGGSGLTKMSTTLVQSTGGMNFDGALVGSSLVMFMQGWPGTLTSVTYPASGATTEYVSDLTPNTTYNIAGAGTPSTATTDTAGVLVFSATGTGIITVSANGVVVDTTPPTTSITAPAGSATVSSTISVSATASDNVGVTSVSLYVDGSLKSTDNTAPYTFSLDTTSLSNGSHTLSTRASDAAGNIGTSGTVTVTVSNIVADTTPPSTPTGLTLSSVTASSITFSWTASSDNVGVTGYNIYRGGVKIATSSSALYINTGLTASTTYLYTVSAYDAAGNTSAQSGGLTGATTGGGSSDVTPPTASITAPLSGATLSGTASVTATAADNVGVTSVALYVDGLLEATDNTAPYTFSLNTTSLINGTHILDVKAYDAAGNVGTSANVSITASNIVATGGGGGGASSGSGGGGGGGGGTSAPSLSITSVSVDNITSTSAKITVTTHIAASIVVKYGRTTLYGTVTQASPALVTNYVTLSGLAPNTVYDYIIIATPPGGTSIISENDTFTTGGGSTGTGATTIAQAPVFTENLSYGDTNQQVVLLQTILHTQGFLPASVLATGYFGTQTEHALLLFQSAHLLNKSGFVDVQSEALLNKIANAAGSALPPTAGTVTQTPTTTTASGSLTQNLGPGSVNSQVTILQHILNNDGDYPAAIYSVHYGALTEAAVKVFQAKYGIISYGLPTTTGYGAVGPKTRGRLNAL